MVIGGDFVWVNNNDGRGHTGGGGGGSGYDDCGCCGDYEHKGGSRRFDLGD